MAAPFTSLVKYHSLFGFRETQRKMEGKKSMGFSRTLCILLLIIALIFYLHFFLSYHRSRMSVRFRAREASRRSESSTPLAIRPSFGGLRCPLLVRRR